MKFTKKHSERVSTSVYVPHTFNIFCIHQPAEQGNVAVRLYICIWCGQDKDILTNGLSGFPQFPQANSGMIPQLGHHCLPQNPFQFIICHIFSKLALCSVYTDRDVNSTNHTDGSKSTDVRALLLSSQLFPQFPQAVLWRSKRIIGEVESNEKEDGSLQKLDIHRFILNKNSIGAHFERVRIFPANPYRLKLQ
jgi:hypothetical protein